MNSELITHLHQSMRFESDAVVDAFINQLKKKYGESIVAIVFYGSCARTKKYDGAVLDFYVIVDQYIHAYTKKSHAILNKLLPPNVYFMQLHCNEQTYQAKYAVVSQTDLEQSTSKQAFHPYFWARFAQPFALVFAVDENITQWMIQIQTQAIHAFIHKTSSAVESTASNEVLWTAGLQLTYSAELRAEANNRPQLIYAQNKYFYEGLAQFILRNHSSNKFIFFFIWKMRALYGKLISILRLLKALITFENGVDYIAWKIQRHSGEKVLVSNRLRKYPWLFCWPLMWRLYRSKKIR